MEILILVFLVLPLCFFMLLGYFSLIEERKVNEALTTLAKMQMEYYKEKQEKKQKEKEARVKTWNELEKEIGNACNHRF